MNPEESRELRNWVKLLKDGQNAKKIENFTITLNNLQHAFSGLNYEMKEFNKNSKKSNKFLSKIAILQESIEKQTKTANRFTWVVVVLMALQVAIVTFPYVTKYWLHWI